MHTNDIQFNYCDLNMRCYTVLDLSLIKVSVADKYL